MIHALFPKTFFHKPPLNFGIGEYRQFSNIRRTLIGN